MNSKITEHHQSKPAYIYVRQSTLAQVRHHQESTERQYALRQKALELGWSEAAVRTLDRDLGISGAQTTGRTDFKTLVADVSMGQVGAVFALEVSRLARSNADWHRLLELCALTRTLVIDEDGCYDPADFNDGLLLGLKGTMAQAELHFLRARLLGGKLNKAKKGELRFPLPVGFCYDDEGRIIQDLDEEVRGAVALVFHLFRETGSAYAVVHRFVERGLRFPKRAYGGAWNGKIVWGRLTHGRVLGMLKNPSYAGMYVFGRYQYRRVEAMQDFGSLLRKRPAGLIVTLRIDEYAAPNRKLHFFRSTLLAGNVSLRGAQMKEVFPVASLSFGEILKELKTLQARLNSWKFTP
jgi:DNA invertase Pin-like site-specific DNA recombinase